MSPFSVNQWKQAQPTLVQRSHLVYQTLLSMIDICKWKHKRPVFNATLIDLFQYQKKLQFLPSKMHYNRLLRYYSTQYPLKLWIKHHGSPSIKVPIDGCSNIDDVAEKVGQELNTKFQVALFTSLDKEAASRS